MEPELSRLSGATGIATPKLPDSARADVRLWFIDNMRLLMICGVVVYHAAGIYVGVDFNGYHEAGTANSVNAFVVGIPALLAPSLGMGLFFLIAGYFTPGSYDRKGAASFLRGRLVRLGIPLLLYDLLVDPLVVYITGVQHESFWSFYGPYLLQERTIGPGVAWFIATLLLFNLLYAAWRWLGKKLLHTGARSAALPNYRAILGFVIALGFAIFVLRIWWPIYVKGWPTWWLQLFNIPAGGAFLLQYISFFVLGCIASRHNWFIALTPKMGRDWSLIALVAVIAVIPFIILGIASGTHPADYLGGFHWQALLEAGCEAFLDVGLCIGLLVLFRQYWNRQGRLTKALAPSAYAVYLISSLIIVSVAQVFSTVALYPQLKFIIVLILVLPLSFLVGFILHKIPLVNRIF
jgi:surface polysaccharide O-acyltransferase-like enzyme